MTETPQWKLSEFFKRFAPRYVLGTSYTASPVFFETSILPKIDRRNLAGAVVLCDLKGFQMAAQEVGALRAASTIYSLVYPNCAGAFHPKVWIMADNDQVAVLCGSGNLTQSGFINNLELFETFEVFRGGGDRELCRELTEFVKGLLGMWSLREQQERPGLKTIVSMIRLLEDLHESNQAQKSRKLWFLSSFQGGFAEQLAKVVDCRELRVASPYFGGGLEGVKNLARTLGAKDIEVFPAKQGEGVDLEPKELEQWQKKPLRQLGLQGHKGNSGRFAHLKLYGLVDRNGGCFSMTGSVNATMAALESKNIEAAVLRKIDRPVFDSLFAAFIPRKPLTHAPPDYSSSGTGWIGIHAVLKSSGIFLGVDSTHQNALPLENVSATWICGPKRETRSYGRLFHDRTLERLGSDQYPGWLEGSMNAAAVEIKGTKATGDEFRSFALVESFADLTATPLQRNAAAAMRALLSGEEVPEAAGINAIFRLCFQTLDAEDINEGFHPSSSTTTPEKERPVRVPIWPPVAVDENAGRQGQHAGGNVAWFQRIMTSLLREKPKETVSAVREMEPSDTEGEEGGERAKPNEPKKPKEDDATSSRIRRWRDAERYYSTLTQRMNGAVIYARPCSKGKRAEEFEMPHKERLLPVAFQTLLITLLLHPGNGTVDEGVPVVLTNDLISGFLRLLVDDRSQPDTWVTPKAHPYRHWKFPPILQDIMDDPELEAPHDLILLGVALFAILHADARNDEGFPLLVWLKFRHFTGLSLTLDETTKSEVLEHALHYLPRSEGGFGLKGLDSALTAMEHKSWKNYPGFSYLQTIRAAANGDEVKPESFGRIVNWAEFRRRLERKAKGNSIQIVNHLRPMCVQDGCSNANTREPTLRPIESLIPCICSACGTALVPELLSVILEIHEA
ncbi:hypothetical protein OVA24_05795 [Luteolibacter sp. SL250]|uniref:hypothetical protein n=1 Tax=Luteolibacter sp. SL250 TaxID=2995170 RepID=UPI00226F2354|nr:hypothetical protein [Luteolibacter sp. SL250]WAC20894.1 hypothetical protein OVA24_05795 [Luteolibacter sp. SL250]